MDKVQFRTMDALRKSVEKNLELLKLMEKQYAPTHAMALVVYSSTGGYNRVLRALRNDIESATDASGYAEKILVERTIKLRQKAADMVATLRADGVLTSFMIEKIAYRYLKNPDLIRATKGYMHSELGTMIRGAIRGW